MTCWPNAAIPRSGSASTMARPCTGLARLVRSRGQPPSNSPARTRVASVSSTSPPWASPETRAARRNDSAARSSRSRDSPRHRRRRGHAGRTASARPRPGRRARGEHEHRPPSVATAPRRRSCLSSAAAVRIRVSGTPQRSAVLTKGKELVQFARQYGHRQEELVEIIQSLPRSLICPPATRMERPSERGGLRPGTQTSCFAARQSRDTLGDSCPPTLRSRVRITSSRNSTWRDRASVPASPSKQVTQIGWWRPRPRQIRVPPMRSGIGRTGKHANVPIGADPDERYVANAIAGRQLKRMAKAIVRSTGASHTRRAENASRRVAAETHGLVAKDREVRCQLSRRPLSRDLAGRGSRRTTGRSRGGARP
jgi:hypothetical protein